MSRTTSSDQGGGVRAKGRGSKGRGRVSTDKGRGRFG